MKKKKILIIVIVLVLVAGAASGLYVYFKAEDDAGDSLLLYGNVDMRQIQLAFHSTGRIQDIYVREGEAVKTGQPVAHVDPVRYESLVEEARARVETRKQVLARLQAGSRPEEIASARARVKATEAELLDADKNYKRMQALAETNTVSREKLDDARARFATAQARHDEAQQALALALKGPRTEDIAAARSQLKADTAALALAEKELADTKLYAPSQGVIQERILEPGDMAFPSSPVLTLALDDPLWVRAYVSEPDLGRIRSGMMANIKTDSFPGKVYKGWIGFISPTAEFTPKQVETSELRSKLVYLVRVYVHNPEGELRLGMPATVIIPLNQPDAPASPKENDP